MFVKLNTADEIVAVADTEAELGGCMPGQYVLEIGDNRQLVVGEVLPPPPECDGQTSIFDMFDSAA